MSVGNWLTAGTALRVRQGSSVTKNLGNRQRIGKLESERCLPERTGKIQDERQNTGRVSRRLASSPTTEWDWERLADYPQLLRKVLWIAR